MSEYFDYLNELRDSGDTNMLGAGAYLEAEFDLDRREAKTILMAWMQHCRESVQHYLQADPWVGLGANVSRNCQEKKYDNYGW